MNQISLRLYIFICLLWMKLQAWGQSDLDDDDLMGGGTRSLKGDNFEELFDEMEHVPRMHIRFSDIMWTVIIIASCYVFGKIWKGCTYLIIFLVAMYIMVFRMHLL